ncbi:LysR substrate-binding domain-containing protein [Paraburkholderia sp. DHOC27]|uniref:LysR substrate-binding domain-containing protein n=1 Tax=Paraburkholderia sp. DHOC27 TaxID=2303330 RepID=UPI000E3D7710|nr:LysR substrate-binding domain-containing protein [Paraburkholderia sp. DHOC27]RFU44897.1 LysR family transcriptional regulator [Paraburkholderia sp. DHOC27]
MTTLQLDSSLLGALRCFEVAARHLNFTKAAAETHLTQSAVSQQIRNLEDRLGYPLFVRQARGLVLTHRGGELAVAATRCLAELSHTLQRLAQSDLPLHVNCSPSFALQWLMPRLSEYQQNSPDYPVRLKADFHGLDLNAMLASEIDVAIRYDPNAYDSGFARELMPEHLVVVGTPAYLARHEGLRNGELTEGVTFLHDAEPWEGAPAFIEWQTWTSAIQPGWTAHIAGPQFNLASLAIAAALNHQGIAIGRTALIEDELRSGRLVKVIDRHVVAPARYVLLNRTPDDTRTATFVSWIEAECQRFASGHSGDGRVA